MIMSDAAKQLSRTSIWPRVAVLLGFGLTAAWVVVLGFGIVALVNYVI